MIKLKELRQSKNMSQQELADYLGVGQSTLSGWERGATCMTSDAMIKAANLFDVSIDYLVGNEQAEKEMKRFIVLPAQNVKEISPDGILPPSAIKRNEHLCLLVTGDSMEPDIKEGDIAIVRMSDSYKSESIVALSVEDNCRALQHVTKVDSGIILRSLNPKYRLVCYSTRQLKSRRVRIVGRLVEIRRRYL